MRNKVYILKRVAKGLLIAFMIIYGVEEMERLAPKRGVKEKKPKRGDVLMQVNVQLWKSHNKFLNKLLPSKSWHIRQAILEYLENHPEVVEKEWRTNNERRYVQKV